MKDYNFYTVLLHFPVLNRKKEIVATAITNLDIHDIARASKTMGIKKYYIVTPIKEQIALVNRVVGHWKTKGVKRNHFRTEALSIVCAKPKFTDVLQDIRQTTGLEPLVVSTTARRFKKSISYNDFTQFVKQNPKYAYVLVFGTGWGLLDEFIESSDFILEPLEYGTGYNHLPVRSAVSIILDRVFFNLTFNM